MQPAYDEIRALIEQRYRRRLRLWLHFTVFAMAMTAVFMWVVTHSIYPGDYKNFLLIPLWILILVVHWLSIKLADARDREIETAWGRYGQKPEHWEPDTSLRLSDEDEWTGWTDQPQTVQEKSKRHG